MLLGKASQKYQVEFNCTHNFKNFTIQFGDQLANTYFVLDSKLIL